MYAYPNPLNKILPCYIPVPLEQFGGTAGFRSQGGLGSSGLDSTVQEWVKYRGFVPYNIKENSTLKFIIRWCVLAPNETGSSKYACLFTKYNSVGVSGVIGSQKTTDVVVVEIPTDIVVGQINQLEVCSVNDIAAGDNVEVWLHRDVDDESDDWTGDLIVLFNPYLECLINKLGS